MHLPEGAKIAAVFQEDRLVMHMSAAANLKLVCPQETDARIAELLNELGLDGASSAPVRSYSGGMRRRAAIARAVLTKPDILFLDEPFTGLDEDVRRVSARCIREEMKNGLIVVVTHDMDEAELLGVNDRLSLAGAKA